MKQLSSIRRSVFGLVTILPLVALPALALDPTIGATQYAVSRWRDVEGLPASAILAVLQTRDGYLWLGTDSGLVRFDGMKMVPQSLAPVRLRRQTISALATDAEGSLWIGTSEGIVVRRGGRYSSIALGVRTHVRSLKVVGSDVYAATHAGLFRIRGGKVESFTTAQGLPSNAVHAVITRGQNLLIATSAGLAMLDHRGTITVPDTLRGTYTRALLANGDGSLWIGTNQELLRTSADGTVILERHPLDRSPVASLLRDKDGIVWANTMTRSFRRTPAEKTFTFTPLLQGGVASLIEDREGSLIAGTYVGGLQQLRDTSFHTLNRFDGLDMAVFTTITGTDGALWMATARGVVRYDPKSGAMTRLTTSAGLPSDLVSGVAEGPAGTMWMWLVGGAGARLQNGRITTVDWRPLVRGGVSTMLAEPDGGLWLGGSGGGVTHVRGETVTRYERESGLPEGMVLTIQRARDGGIWIGVADAPLFLLKNGRVTRPLPHDEHLSDVSSIVEDADGTLWLGTAGSGLSLVRNGKISHFDKSDGLRGDKTTPIADDGLGYLWIGSDYGVTRVAKSELLAHAGGRPGALHVREFGLDDGLLRADLAGGSTCRTPDGRLWFASSFGAAFVDPRSLRTNDTPPLVRVEQLVVDGHELAGSQLRTPSTARRLAIHYSGLSLIAAEKVSFRYKLEPLDDQWVDGGNGRVATYVDVPPGQYRFVVQARNASGVWSDDTAGISFERPPRLHETVAFRAAVALAGCAVLFLLYRLRVRELRRRQKQLELVVEERTMLLEQANESLRQMSQRDALTGIANRRHFDSHLANEWSRSHRTHSYVSMLLMDVDHFKLYNDHYGHVQGDECLKQVAKAIAAQVGRAGDVAARYGGEEFAVILSSTDLEGALAVGETIRAAVAALRIPHAASRSGAYVTVSVGAATMMPFAADGSGSIIEAADEALYSAKESGRNRVLPFAPRAIAGAA